MPTLKDAIDHHMSQGTYPEFEKAVEKRTGRKMRDLNPNADWATFSAGLKALKGAQQTKQALTKGDEFIRLVQMPRDIGQQLSPGPIQKPEEISLGWMDAPTEADRAPGPLLSRAGAAVVEAGTAAAGAAKSVPETVMDYAAKPLSLAAGMMLAGQDPRFVQSDPVSQRLQTVRDYKGETPGEEHRRTVIAERLGMPVYERAVAPFKEMFQGMASIAAPIVTGDMEAAARVGEDLGRGLVRGPLGMLEHGITHPDEARRAQFMDVVMMGDPLARGVGAAARGAALARYGIKGATKGASRRARAAHFAADVLDPQAKVRTVEKTVSADVDDAYSRVQKRAEELQAAEDVGRVAEGTTQDFLSKFGERPRIRTVYEGPPDTMGSKVGRGLRSAYTGAALLGDAFGGGVVGPVLAAGATVGAPAMWRYAMSKTKDPALQEARMRQAFVDPAAMPDPGAEQVTREAMEAPVHAGAAIVSGGHEVAARMDAEGRGRGRVEFVEGQEGFRHHAQRMVVDPDTGRMRYMTAAQQARVDMSKAVRDASVDEIAFKHAADATRARAIELAKEARKAEAAAYEAAQKAGEEGRKPTNYMGLGRHYINDLDRLQAMRRRSGKLSENARKLAEENPAAYDYYRAQLQEQWAKEAFIEAKIRASVRQQLKAQGMDATSSRLLNADRNLRSAENAVKAFTMDDNDLFKAKEIVEQERRVEAAEKVLFATIDAEQKGHVTPRPGAREHVAAILESERELLREMERTITNKEQWREAKDYWRQARDEYDAAARENRSVFETAGTAARDLYQAIIDRQEERVKAKARREAMELLPEEQRKQIKKDARAMGMDRVEAENLMMQAATLAKKNALRAERMSYQPDILPLLLQSRAAKAKLTAVQKRSARLPQSEQALRRAAKQDEFIGPINKQALVVSDPLSMEFINETSRILSEVSPDSRLADPNYLSQVVANIWNKKALTAAFSERARGAFSKQVADNIVNHVKLDKVRDWLWDATGEKPKKGKKALHRQVRQYIEKRVSDEVAASIMGGRPRDMELWVPTPEGSQMIGFGEMAAAMIGSNKKEYRGIAQDAIAGLFENIRSHVQRDALSSSLGREARRSVPFGGKNIDPNHNAMEATRVLASGEAPPAVIMFNPDLHMVREDGGARYQAYRDEMNARIVDQSDQLGPLDAKRQVDEARQFYSRNYVEADSEVGAAVRTGLAKQGIVIPPETPVYVRKGLNQSVGQHIRFIQESKAAGDMVANMSREASIVFLAHTTASSAANGFSNFGALAMDHGGLIGVTKKLVEAERTIHAYEQGKLQGREAMQVRALVRQGILDSDMLVTQLRNIGLGSSSGRGPAVIRRYHNFRKAMYRHIDNVPKVVASWEAFKTNLSLIEDLEPGRAMLVDTGKGRFMQVRKNGDGSIQIGDLKEKYPLHSQQVYDKIAQMSVAFAKGVFFDFNDLPGFAKGILSKKNAFTSIANLYGSWFWKAAELPGKRGLARNLLGYDPTARVITDSPTVSKRRAKAFVNQALKRQMFLSSMQGARKYYTQDELVASTGFDGATQMGIVNPYSREMEEVERVDLGSANPFVVFDYALRLANAGVLAGRSGLASMFEWAGMDTGGLDPVQHLQKLAKSDNPDDQRTARLYAAYMSNDLASWKTLLEYALVTGGILGRVLDYTKDETNVRKGGVMRLIARLMFGGDMSSLAQLAIEQGDPGNIFVGKRDLKHGTNEIQRRERTTRWFMGEMFRFGWRPTDIEGARSVEGYIARRKKAITEGFIKPYKQKAEKNEAEARATVDEQERAALNARAAKFRETADFMERMRDEVIDQYTVRMEKARDNFQKMRRHRFKGHKGSLDPAKALVDYPLVPPPTK